MAGQREGTGPVVEADARMRAPPIELIGVEIRKPARPQQLVDFGHMALADQRYAVDAALDQRADLAHFFRLVIVARGDQQLIAEFLQPSLQRRDTGREDPDAERRYDMADGERLARGKRARRPVPDVAEFAHRAHDALANP